MGKKDHYYKKEPLINNKKESSIKMNDPVINNKQPAIYSKEPATISKELATIKQEPITNSYSFKQ